MAGNIAYIGPEVDEKATARKGFHQLMKIELSLPLRARRAMPSAVQMPAQYKFKITFL